jgi:predicted dehydrogenase
VYGTKGTVRQGKVYIGSGHDVKPQDLSAAQIAGHPYEPEVEHFLDCILHDKPTLVDAIEGANSAVGVLKAAESIQRGGEKLSVPVYRR